MASSSSSSSKKITLKSSDGERFEVDENAAMLSVTIKNMIEDISDSDRAIPVPNVSAAILGKVIEYCNKHSANENSESEGSAYELQQWDKDFLKVDPVILFDLILAANYMDIESLLELTCQCVADMLKEMSIQEIRNTFNIESDFTPEEEEQNRSESRWAFK